MVITHPKSLYALTAADLATPLSLTFRTSMSIQDAARQLAEAKVNGGPVVDDTGRLVGVLSTYNLLRSVTRENTPSSRTVRSCALQKPIFGQDGIEIVRCRTWPGTCPDQGTQHIAGRAATVCTEPHDVSSSS